MIFGRRNRSNRSKPSLLPLCPPQIPQYLTWHRTRPVGVENGRLTPWAIARPSILE
jgi:hypothetical protein